MITNKRYLCHHFHVWSHFKIGPHLLIPKWSLPNSNIDSGTVITVTCIEIFELFFFFFKYLYAKRDSKSDKFTIGVKNIAADRHAI